MLRGEAKRGTLVRVKRDDGQPVDGPVQVAGEPDVNGIVVCTGLGLRDGVDSFRLDQLTAVQWTVDRLFANRGALQWLQELLDGEWASIWEAGSQYTLDVRDDWKFQAAFREAFGLPELPRSELDRLLIHRGEIPDPEG